MIEPMVWRVLKNCKFVGYVTSYSAMGAQLMAQKKYGSNCLISSTNLKMDNKK